jgi:hypothetical protein
MVPKRHEDGRRRGASRFWPTRSRGHSPACGTAQTMPYQGWVGRGEGVGRELRTLRRRGGARPDPGGGIGRRMGEGSLITS